MTITHHTGRHRREKQGVSYQPLGERSSVAPITLTGLGAQGGGVRL